MKLVFVYWGYENAGSMLDLRGYVRAARGMGHEVMIYGPPHPTFALDFSMDLKNASDSAWCASRPRVGSGWPGQNTAVSAECRFLNTAQSWSFHESSSVFIRCRLSSAVMCPSPW